jgi:phosphatidylserine/phosphatidylglycerophosphate/cardiolipin synthase-like enzyme
LARKRTLDALTDGLQLSPGVFDRVAVFNLWNPSTALRDNRGIHCHAKAQTYDGSLFVCGSCNLNQRSLTYDSEVSCATVDPTMVREHQKALWSWLFPETSWPKDIQGTGIDLDTAGAGIDFFYRFQEAAAQDKSLLIPDKWWLGPYHLPNGVLRDQHVSSSLFSTLYRRAMDPMSPEGSKLMELMVSMELDSGSFLSDDLNIFAREVRTDQ